MYNFAACNKIVIVGILQKPKRGDYGETDIGEDRPVYGLQKL